MTSRQTKRCRETHILFYFLCDTNFALMRIDEGTDVCTDRSKWKAVVSAYPNGNGKRMLLKN